MTGKTMKQSTLSHLILAGILTTAFTASLTGCQNTPVKSQSQVVMPQKFNYVLPVGEQSNISTWWQNFHDPVLTSLIEHALQTAPDIREAKARIDEASAVANLANANKGIMVGAGGSITGVNSDVDNPLPSKVRKPLGMLGSDWGDSSLDVDGHAYHLGILASWEPDFFGKKQSDADAAGYAYLATQEKIHGAHMLVAAKIAQAYFQARSKEQEALILKQTQSSLSELRRYAKARFDLGQATRYDIDDIDIKLQGIKAKQDNLSAERQANIRQIAVLSGKTSQDFDLPPTPVNVLKHLPPAPQGYYPSDLLTRRPDIRAKQAQVNALAALHGSAVADQYPRFGINFGALNGGLSISNNDLDSTGITAGLINANVSVPLFTNGRIKHNIEAADARVQAVMADYDKTLLTALAEVDNSSQLNTALIRQHRNLQNAVKDAELQADHAKKLFNYGRLTFDDMPKARITAQEYEQNLIQNELGQALNLIALYNSLGGGW